MKKSTIIALIFLAVCVLSVIAFVVYGEVYIPYKIEKEEQAAKEDILYWLAKDGNAHCVLYDEEPWYDEYMMELFPTLTDEQFCTTIVDMIYKHYDVRKIVSDEEVAERLLPDILDPDWRYREGSQTHYTIGDLIRLFNIWEYHNPYLLNGIKDALTWDGKSLDDLYNMADYYFRALSAGDDPEYYYYFYLVCDEDDLMKQIEGHQEVFYTKQGFGGYYDGRSDGYSGGDYVGNSSSSSYYGDFLVRIQSSVEFSSTYDVIHCKNETHYFRGKPISLNISIDDAKYYTGSYLIFIDDKNNLELAKYDGNSYDVVDGIKLK